MVRLRGGALVHLFQSWTATYTESDIEILGSEGFVRARNAMMPTARAEVVLSTAAGETTLDLEDEPVYERVVRLFNGAIRGDGEPSAPSGRHALARPGARHPRGGRNRHPRDGRDLKARPSGSLASSWATRT